MNNEQQTMYTSYFNSPRLKSGNIPNGYKVISIAKGTPPYFDGECLECVKPSWDLVNSYKSHEIDNETYTKIYFRELSGKISSLSKHIEEIKDGGKFIYLCHCGKDRFCHRHLWAEFLNKVGIKCEELV